MPLMLDRISLANFKASRLVDLRLGALTILSGLNGSGKSTLLQSLAILKQSYSRAGRIDAIRTRGALVQLGTFGDLLSDGAESELITIGLREGSDLYEWSFTAEPDEAVATLVKRPPEGCAPRALMNDGFQILHADRIVPQTLYSRSTTDSFGPDFLGARGEYTAEFLANSSLAGVKVSAKRICPNEGLYLSDDLFGKVAPTSGLLDQVAGWLQQLSPGARISSAFVPGTDEVVMQYDYVGRTGIADTGRHIRPSNVGFGLTYCLPIIVACLAAKPGSLLLLENPEAHLHPQGQVALGELVARTASDGVQVIVETHSDHLLNGVRLAVRRHMISNEDVVAHYFKRGISTGDVQVQTPALLSGGQMAAWPEGFFDQWDISLEKLLG
jgi:predicted ATPase